MMMNRSVTSREIALILFALRNLDERAIAAISSDIERAFKQCTKTKPTLTLVKGGKSG